ncbi:MAG: histone deacetylase [Candidatus Omnitrophica bacterium]|nr:histone deacetylase [Candidatus Omnitrophota bacterium]
MSTAFIYSEGVLNHDTGLGHPENSGRIESVLSCLKKEAWFSNSIQHQFPVSQPEILSSIHHPAYIQKVKNLCTEGVRFIDSPDVAVCPDSFGAALLSADMSLALVDRIFDGPYTNGFVLTRPPGHHAKKSEAMGFCLFNNIAVAVKYAQQKYKLSRVAIVDWDVHHGNGTQDCFYDDPSVFYASIHQFPFYPGTGRKDETGSGRGRNATLNMPLPAGCGDIHYKDLFESVLLPALDNFRPEAVFISAGFDAHADDPLGSMNLSSEMYRWMTKKLTETANRYSDGHVLSFLEGGYHPQALTESISMHLSGLMNPTD